jgi:predicted phosphodiesterase
MIKPLRCVAMYTLVFLTKTFISKLLDNLDFHPSKDVLIHTGDIVTKGTHKGSMEVMGFMTLNNVTGVRGNHDQKVIEWRVWLEWIEEKPRGKQWLESLEKHWERAHGNDKSLDVESLTQPSIGQPRRTRHIL